MNDLTHGKTNSSSGNWFADYLITRRMFNGKPYTTRGTKFFWRKADMLEFLQTERHEVQI